MHPQAPLPNGCEHPHRVQALPRAGYRTGPDAPPPVARHLLLTVRDAAAARAVLMCLPTSFEQATSDLPATGLVDIGYTHAGVLKLAGTDRGAASMLGALGVAFREGAARRAARLGDSGPSAAAHWPAAFQPDATDVVLHLHAPDVAALDQLERTLEQRPRWPEAWTPIDATRRVDATGWQRRRPAWNDRDSEPFGFRDGIMNPGLGCESRPVLEAPGDLLLGEVNSVGTNVWDLNRHRPGEATGHEGNRAPHAEFDARVAPRSDWLRGGCFGALRWMEQRVATFEAWVADAGQVLAAHPHFAAWWAQQGATSGGDRDEVCAVFIRSRLVGRWPNGVPVQPGQGYTQPVAPADRLDRSLVDFDYRADAQGRACPFGSHIRRMNPRGPDVVPARARPLVRRGLPWRVIEREGGRETERSGLVGLFFCASLEDQFEHLLAEWAQKPTLGPDHAGRAQDPLIGAHDEPDATMEVWLPALPSLAAPDQPLRLRFDRGPFVVTLGTLYAFYPSLDAHHHLCGACHESNPS